MGEPTEKFATANGGQIWFYSQGPLAAQTYAVHLRSDGVVQAVEQTRVPGNVERLRAGNLTSRDVRLLLGPPDRVARFERTKINSWEYRFREFERMVLFTEFSDDGVLRGVHYLHARDVDRPVPFGFMAW